MFQISSLKKNLYLNLPDFFTRINKCKSYVEIEILLMEFICKYFKALKLVYYTNKTDILENKMNEIVNAFEKIDIKIHEITILQHSDLINKINHEKKPFIIKNNSSTAISVKLQFKQLSDLICPLYRNSSLFGLFIISKYSTRSALIDVKNTWRIISAHVSKCLENIQNSSDRHFKSTLLSRIFSLKTDDLDILFQETSEALLDFSGAKLSSIWMYNELDESLVLRSFYPKILDGASITFSSFDSRVLPLSYSISGHVISSKKPLNISNVFLEDKFCNKKFAKDFDLKTLVSFPIILNTEVLGVLNLWLDDPKKMPNQEKTNFIMAICSAAAIKIRIAQIQEFEELVFSYDDIFNKMVDMVDDKESWDDIARLVTFHMKCEASSIFLIFPDGKLHLKGSTGLIGNPAYDKVIYEKGEGLTGGCFEDNEPIVYFKEYKNKELDKYKIEMRHKSKFREILQTSIKSKSIIFLPILDNNNNKIGVIRCNNRNESKSRRSGRFSKDDISKLRFICKLIHSGYSKVTWTIDKQVERERNLNSLHHEIISPIDGILSHIEWFKHFFNKKMYHYESENLKASIKFEDIEQSGKLIEILVTTLGRMDDLELNCSKVYLHELLQISKSFLLQEAKRENFDLRIKYLTLPKIEIDKYQIIRVFYNLFRNAIKYADDEESEKYIEVSGKKISNKIILSFRDNGIGIIENEQEKIFDKFTRGTNASVFFPQGTGLGLAYCKSIIDKHGGKIYIPSNMLRKPTVFYIELPIKQGDII